MLRQARAQAVADRLGLRIVVLSTFEESPVIQIDPHGGARSDRILHLSFWAEVRRCAAVSQVGQGNLGDHVPCKVACSIHWARCRLASAC